MSVDQLTYIVYTVATLIYIAVLYIYFLSAFDKRYSTKATVAIYVIVCAAYILILPWQSGRINFLINFAAFAVLIHLYLGNLKTRICMALFIYLVAFLSEFFTVYAINLITEVTLPEIEFGTTEFIYGILVSRILLAIFAKFLSRVTSRHRMPKITTSHWLALIVPSVGSLFVLYNFLFLREHSIVDIFSSMVIVVTNFIIINVYDKILSEFDANAKNKVLEEQLKHYGYQSFLAEKSENLILKTKHDIKNMLVGVKTDLRMKNLENIENRVDELLGEIDSFDGPAQSGNLAIDAIINFKSDVAHKHQIFFSVELKIPTGLDVDSIVLCQVLGNALDNAIEATEKVGDAAKRIVQINMSYMQEALLVEILNPYDGEIVTDSRGRILSSKRGFRSEGIGMQNIRNTIDRNQGAVDFSYGGGIFTLSIMLYDIKVNSQFHSHLP